MSHEDHAELSPSSSERWLTCPGSVPLSRGHYSDIESSYATDGTDHHEVAALCLEQELDAKPLVGKPMLSGAILTEDNAAYLQVYLDKIRGYVETNHGSLRVEEEIGIEWLTGEPGGKGKSDAVVFLPIPELIVADLKFGMGVEVFPDHNSQAMIYAAGVLQKHELWDEIKQVRIVIIQPRLMGAETVKEWVCPIADLKAFCEEVKRKAAHIATLVGGAKYLGGRNKNVLVPMLEQHLQPSEKACKFCPAAKAVVCPALNREVSRVTEANVDGFDNETGLSGGMTLGQAMDKSELVELWLHNVRAKVESQLLAGKPVQGKDGFYKLVRGRKGNRKWESESEVEEVMKKFKISEKDMYIQSLISAAAAEKKFSKPLPTIWETLKEYIIQPDGSLSVASPLDKRPAHIPEAPNAKGFEVEDGSDLL